MTKKRPNILVTGFYDFWPRLFVEGLSKRYSNDGVFAWRHWPTTWASRIGFLCALLRSDSLVLITIYFDLESPTIRFILNAAHMLNKRVIKYWLGDDCLYFENQIKSGLNKNEILSSFGWVEHWAASDVVRERLQAQGIDATTYIMPSPERLPEPVPVFPEEFSVVGYWTDNLAEINGARFVMEAARRLPEVPFVIMGATGAGCENPPENVTFIGKFADTGVYMKQAVVHVRHYEFDAVPGGTLEEAYYFGRYVIYTYEYPFADTIAFGDVDSLVSTIEAYRKKFREGALRPNYEAREFIEKSWNPDERFAHIWKSLV